jgi:hypothetical protein
MVKAQPAKPTQGSTASMRLLQSEKMMVKYIIFGISVSIISWMVGMILNGIIAKTEYYKKLSNLNFIESKTLNKRIGIEYFKWIVKNTFFRFFNQQIKVQIKRAKTSCFIQ